MFDQTGIDPTLMSPASDVPIRKVANERTPGLAGARNTGILASRTEWIAFCDDDDMWLPRKLDRQWVRAAADGADFVVGSIVIARGNRRIPRRTGHRSIEVGDLIRNRLPAAHPSTFLVKRSAIDAYIGLVDEQLPGSYAEDYDWLIRAARGRPILSVREAKALVRWHKQSYFVERWEMIDEALAYLVAKTPEFRTDPRGLARILGQRAFAQAASGQRERALATSREAVRLDWRQVRAYVAPLVAIRLLDAERLLKWANGVGRGF